MRSTPVVQPVPARALAQPIRVLLADDHAVTLWGLGQLVQSASPRMCVSGTASTCADLLAHPALERTDVVLLDLDLSGASTIRCVPQLVNDARVKVVVLTGDNNPSHHREAVMRGVRGVVLKSHPTENILNAIERVHAGEVWLDGSLMSLLLGAMPGVAGARLEPKSDARRRIETLTPKEHQVIQAMVAHRGAKSLVVADALGMSEHTLRNHLTVVYSKLNVQGKLDLFVFAVQHRVAPAPAGAAKNGSPNSMHGELSSAWGSLA